MRLIDPPEDSEEEEEDEKEAPEVDLGATLKMSEKMKKEQAK